MGGLAGYGFEKSSLQLGLGLQQHRRGVLNEGLESSQPLSTHNMVPRWELGRLKWGLPQFMWKSTFARKSDMER